MIFTIGHSNHDFDFFLALLKQNKIGTILDVRSVPNSKYAKHFNKSSLKHSLNVNQINYLYAGKNLGGRPSDNSVLNINGKIELDKIEQKEWYINAISKIIEMSINSNIAIMCSEEDPQQCHRGYIITNSLLKRNNEVFHIRGDKSMEKAKFIPRQGVLF